MARVITAENLKLLAFELAKNENVVAPILKHPHSHASQYVFSKLKGDEKIEWHYPTTVLPPKEFLFPHDDPIFSYEGGKTFTEDVEPIVLFGVNLEDLEGINLLTKYFTKPITDTRYVNRLAETTVIGVDRFSVPKNLNFDLYLMEFTPGLFAAFAKTKKGREIIKNKLFTTKEVRIHAVKKKPDIILSNKNLAKAIEKSADHPIWKELAEVCFGCGICTYACPVCYCFDVKDEPELGTENGKRCRNWDSCLLAGFAKTNAKDFRPELEKRIYNWYFHKFVRSPKEYNEIGCVECNRCSIFCPAHIDYKKILGRILKDYENEKL